MFLWKQCKEVREIKDKIILLIIGGIILASITCLIVSQKKLDTSSDEIKMCRVNALERAKIDIGENCYIVAMKQKKDKTGYQVLITNTEDTYAILYDVYPTSSPKYIVKQVISSKGADATKNLLN